MCVEQEVSSLRLFTASHIVRCDSCIVYVKINVWVPRACADASRAVALAGSVGAQTHIQHESET